MLLQIDKIKVENRIRKDLGDIDSLAKDIKENSLLNPITVIPVEDGLYQLIAGERRLTACKQLGMESITVNTIAVRDAEQALMIEISENENRKEFTFSERMDWAKRLEKIESIKARERMASGVKNSSQGKTREIVAEKTGFGSFDTYNKAKYISENAEEEIIEQLDQGEISIHKGWLETKKRLEDKIEELESREPKVIEKVIEKTVPHPKYYETKQRLEDLESETQRLERERDRYKEKSELNKRQSDEYKRIKDDLSLIKQSRESVKRQLDATNELSTLVRQIEHFLKEQLSPIKYSRALRELKHDEHVQRNLNEIIEAVEDWLNEIKTYTDKGEVIDV